VLNLSLGGPSPTGAIHAVLNWASRQGAVVVAAGGNQHGRGDPREYPAAFASGSASQVALPLLAVAALAPTGAAQPGVPRSLNNSDWVYAPFSTLGRYLNVSAPGEALDLGHAQLYSGTSFAAPLVAGTAALLRQASPAASSSAIRALLLNPSRTLSFPGLQPAPDLRRY
jgi:subtilisin family serine protease